MNQNVLTTFSIVSINYLEEERKFHLMSRSLIREEMFLTSAVSEKDFENSLFYIELDDNNREFKSAIEFGQKVILRHKLSNKYLSHSEGFEEEENDTTYMLELSHRKHYFKIMPCFQYQTKISNKIRFNEDVHLVTEISGAKTGYLSSQKTAQDHIRKTIIGMNYYNFLASSKFSFHSYYECEKEEAFYTFGSIIWLSHIESSAFMAARKIEQRKELIFEPIEYEQDLQSISGLWLIESDNAVQGGKLSFDDKFRLKNLSEGLYMSFSKNYKMNQNERVYNMILEEVPSSQSYFIFKSLKDQQAQIKKGSYLIFQHFESKLFVGCRRANCFPGTEIIKPISYANFSDEDLYKIVELEENEEEAIRFILAINEELNWIESSLGQPGTSERKLAEERQIFRNIKQELEKLKQLERLFQKVQGQAGTYISSFARLLRLYREKGRECREHKEQVVEVMRLIYGILIIVCWQHRKNQEESYMCLHHYVEDIFTGIGELKILIETFKNNYSILCQVPKPLESLGGKNIVRVALEMVERFRHNKNSEYWQKLSKFLEFLRTLLFNGQTSIDINQRLISEEFFGAQSFFPRIFFGIKIVNHRLKIEEEPAHYVEVERVRDAFFLTIIEQVFQLFSLLCSNRNFISKKHINLFLTSGTQHGLEILIAYLSMPISEPLTNSLYSLITNLYVDSSPRIDRLKPLSVVNFAFSSDKQSQQEAELSERLKSALLYKIEDSYSSRPLQISNLLAMELKMSMEPSLSHDELALYKEEIWEKMRREGVAISPELLRSITYLIKLESYNDAEVIEIFRTVKGKLRDPALSHEVVVGIMKIIQEVCTYCREVELKKMTAYLKYKYRSQSLSINYSREIEYVLPYAKRLVPSDKNPAEINRSIWSYNQQADILAELQPGVDLKLRLFELLAGKGSAKVDTHLEEVFFEEVYKCFNLVNFPKQEFLRLLMNSIVVTSEEVDTFEHLFDLYKKLKHLTAISEYWLCGESDNQHNRKSYIRYMVEVTLHLHKDYASAGEAEEREFKALNDYRSKLVRSEEVYVNRQLLLRNIGFENLVLELLETNYYLLDVQTERRAKKPEGKSPEMQKHLQVFSLCFEFIYGFIYNCNETKDIIHRAWSVLGKYQDLMEVGQTRVYKELYKNKLEYVRQIKKEFIECIITKVVPNTRSQSNEGCEFNPELLSYLESVIKIDGEIYKPNLETVYRLIEKPQVFRKIMFAEDDGEGKVKLCLNLFQIKTDIIQVPYFYHIKILSILHDMLVNLDSQSSGLKSKLRSLFNFNHFLQILAGKDVYTDTDFEAQMNFLLKREVMKIVSCLLDRNDSINLLQGNQDLLELVNFYYRVHVGRAKKASVEVMNQALYEPYLKEYRETLEHLEKNERSYFREEVKPFLVRIREIFVKAKKEANNPVCAKIEGILEMAEENRMTEYFEYRKKGHNIDKVSFRWLNFVDRDENNSPEEKFAKFTIVEILRNNVVKRELDRENDFFFKQLLAERKVPFIEVLLRLLRMHMEKEYIESESEETYYQLHRTLSMFCTLVHSLGGREQEAEVVGFLGEHSTGLLFFNYCCRIEFDFSKAIVRRIFHLVLRILLFTITRSDDQKALKELFTIFNDNPLGFRFWSHLSESILIISAATQLDTKHQQVNWCLKNIYLLPEEKDDNLSEESLRFLRALCGYFPFTKFLRYQPLYPSRDFLEIIYHSFSNALMPKNQIVLNVMRVEIAETLMDTMSAFMLGGNEANQNFVVDSKFPEVLTEVLKIESYSRKVDEGEAAERDRLVDEVIEFYNLNGIDIEMDIRRKVRVLDFNHMYMLNRLKCRMLHCLMNCVAANEMVANKIRFQIPVELLKINLIWVYEDFKLGKHAFEEGLIMRELEDWESLCQKEQINGIFLEVGFYIFCLLENSEAEKEEGNEEEEGLVDEKEKNKEKLVKKFFHTIAEKKRKKEKLEKLENEPFAEEMKRFYEEYYAAIDFFKDKTLSIEVNFLDQLTKISFPRIPLADKMTPLMVMEFKQEAVRISQEEKIKSLLEFEEESYVFLEGEEEFFQRFRKIPFFEAGLRALEEDKLRLLALCMCLIQTVLFFVENYLSPTFSFGSSLLFNPSSALKSVMQVVGILNLVIGFLLAFYLFFKKLPILWGVTKVLQKKRDSKERERFLNGENFYTFKQIFPQLFFLFLYVCFLVASFVHPFFAGWILFDVMNRLTLGRQLIRSVMESWFQLLGAIVLLLVINYLYSMYVYVQFASEYAPACEAVYSCLLLLVDQSLKSGSGFLGSTPIDYVDSQFNLKFISEWLYIIFAQKVVFEIFSGIIIDKFSELREEQEAMEEDENTTCFICGQERFVIDFELEGFEEHIGRTHNPLNYIFYLFYLRRKDPKNYNIIDKYISECQRKQKKIWIPDDISILKLLKEKDKQIQEDEDEGAKISEYLDLKAKDLKQLRTKTELIISELRQHISKAP